MRALRAAQPPKPKAQSAPQPVKATVTRGSAPAPRNLFSGTVKKLEVFATDGTSNDPVPGYRTYWFSDKDGGTRLKLAQRSGWEFVKEDEVMVSDAGLFNVNNDLG